MKKENFEMRKKLEDISAYTDFPHHMVLQNTTDHCVRNRNVEAGRTICIRCDGTGNECYTIYKECTICKGKGYQG